MRLIAVLGCCLASALATPAFAQTRPAPQVSSPPPVFTSPIRPYRGLDAPNDPYRAEALQQRVFAEVQTRIARGLIPQARLDRAGRVGALIDQGLCGPAAQLARAEHDDAMADRVPDACAAHRSARHS